TVRRGLKFGARRPLSPLGAGRVERHPQREQRRREREHARQGAVAHQPIVRQSLSLELAHQFTTVLICRIGVRIEKTMKPTTPPRKTIIRGSSMVVIALTRTSTWPS